MCAGPGGGDPQAERGNETPGMATGEDRVVQTAMTRVLEPIFEAGCSRLLLRVQAEAERQAGVTGDSG
jgi:hypothetical protein